MAYPDNLPPESQVVPAGFGVLIVASGSEFTPGRAFHANVDETITVQFKDSAATTDLVVKAGNIYPYSIKKVTVGTGVVLVR